MFQIKFFHLRSYTTNGSIEQVKDTANLEVYSYLILQKTFTCFNHNLLDPATSKEFGEIFFQ